MKKYLIILVGLIIGVSFGFFVFVKGLSFGCPYSGACGFEFSWVGFLSASFLKRFVTELIIGLILYFLIRRLNRVFISSLFIGFLIVIVSMNVWSNTPSKLCIPDCGVKIETNE